MERRHEIASIYSERLRLPEDFLENYLLHHINYDMGPEHIRGLQEYYRLALDAGYIHELKPLQFLQTQNQFSQCG